MATAEVQSLLDFPPEVLLRVVDILPLREIPPLRQTCKKLRTLVDSYELALATPRITKSLQRFNDEVREVDSYNEPRNAEDFFEGLQYWYRKRGCFEDPITNTQFLSVWLTQLHYPLQREGPGAAEYLQRIDRVRSYLHLSIMLTVVRERLDADREVGQHESWHRDQSEMARRYMEEDISRGDIVATQDQLCDLMKTVCRSDVELWATARDILTPTTPVGLLTTCRVDSPYIEVDTGEQGIGVCRGVVTSHDLGELLGLPALPATNTFAYAAGLVDAGGQWWAYDFLMDSVTCGRFFPPMRAQ